MTNHFPSLSEVCVKIKENNIEVSENLHGINQTLIQNSVNLGYDLLWVHIFLNEHLPIKTSSGKPVLPMYTRVWPLKLSQFQTSKFPYLFSSKSVELKKDVELQNSFALPCSYFIEAEVMFEEAIARGMTVEQLKTQSREILDPVVKQYLDIQQTLKLWIKPFSRFSENMYSSGNFPLPIPLPRLPITTFPRPRINYQMTFFEKPFETQNPLETIVGFVFKLPN